MDNHTVDILIPVFKTEFLAECLTSVMGQPSLGRVILLNNTGSEDIYSITSGFSEQIKIIQPNKPLPVVTACLILAESAETEWIKFLNDSDILAENAITSLLDMATSFDGITMSFSATNLLKQDGHKKIITYDFPEYINGTDYLFNIYQEAPFTTLSGAIIKKDSIKNISRLIPDNIMSICGLFAMHAMIDGNLTYINTPTVTIRQPEYRIIPASLASADFYHIVEPIKYFISKKPEEAKRAKWLKAKLVAALADEHSIEYLTRGRYSEFIYLMRALFSLKPQAGFLSLLDHRLYRVFMRRLFRRIHR